MLNQLGANGTSFTHLDVVQWIDADEEQVPDIESGDNSEEEVAIVPELKNSLNHLGAVNSFNVYLKQAEENDVGLPRQLKEADRSSSDQKFKNKLVDITTLEIFFINTDLIFMKY